MPNLRERTNLETRREKRQLEYLCIRTVGGVLAYARGPNGLLRMDAITDELTDKDLFSGSQLCAGTDQRAAQQHAKTTEAAGKWILWLGNGNS